MLKRNRKSQSGFSLVELMVVVAIIGVLASIAVPSINKYLSKARQSEAKTQLSSIYTSEKSFYAEYQTYDVRFLAVGYSPEGKLRYNVGFAANHINAGPANGYTSTPPLANFAALGFCAAPGLPAPANGCLMLLGATGAAPPAIPAARSSGSATAFQAAAIARISSTAAALDDIWTMNELKILTNAQDGIR